MTLKNKKRSRANFVGICFAGAAILLFLIWLCIALIQKNQLAEHPSILQQIASYKGYSRTIEKEEFEFFKSIASRELRDGEDLEQNTKNLIQDASAQFYLGNKLKICKPYSFESMKRELEQENADRRLKKERGEPIYGLDQFDLLSYYQYVSSNLRLDIIRYLTEHADEEMIAKAKEYYEMHVQNYTQPESITYTLTMQDETKEYTVTDSEFNTLEKTDGELFQILLEGEEGEVFSYLFGGTEEREGQIKQIVNRQPNFELDKSAAIQDFLLNGYYEELLQMVSQQNPVSYAQD